MAMSISVSDDDVDSFSDFLPFAVRLMFFSESASFSFFSFAMVVGLIFGLDEVGQAVLCFRLIVYQMKEFLR